MAPAGSIRDLMPVSPAKTAAPVRRLARMARMARMAERARLVARASGHLTPGPHPLVGGVGGGSARLGYDQAASAKHRPWPVA